MFGSSGTPNHHHISEDDDELANGNHIHSRDLDIDESIRDPVEDRRTLAERSERLHDQLRVSTLDSDCYVQAILFYVHFCYFITCFQFK